MKIRRIIFPILFLVQGLYGQEMQWQPTLQAIANDSTLLVCRSDDFWFYSHSCGLEVRLNGELLESHYFEKGDWQEKSLNQFYYIDSNLGLLFVIDTQSEWAFIMTPRGRMQLYRNAPECFKYEFKPKK